MINSLSKSQVNPKSVSNSGPVQKVDQATSDSSFLSMLVDIVENPKAQASCENLDLESKPDPDIEEAQALLAALCLSDTQYLTLSNLPIEEMIMADGRSIESSLFVETGPQLVDGLSETLVESKVLLEQVEQSSSLITKGNQEVKVHPAMDNQLLGADVVKEAISFDERLVSWEAIKSNSLASSEAVLEAEQYQGVIQQVKQQMLSKQQQGQASGDQKDRLDVEALPKKLQVVNENYPNEGIKQVEMAFDQQLSEAKPHLKTSMILKQVTEGISQGLTGASQAFIIKLKPASLGEITVRLVQDQQQMSLSIITASEETAKLLNSQLSILSEALKPYNAEIGLVTSQKEALEIETRLVSQDTLSSFQQHHSQGFQQSRQSALVNPWRVNKEYVEGSVITDDGWLPQYQGLDRYI